MSTARTDERDARDAQIRAAEQIYRDWDDALGRKDLEAAMRLYADDATIESPLVSHLLGQNESAVSGKDDLRNFVRIVFERAPLLRRRFRNHLFTDGTLLMWEYPRVAPSGEQMDLVEVMELRNGLIQHHRVYWGWRSVQVLQRDEYRKD